MTRETFAHPAVTAALATAADLLGMEVVFIGGLSHSTFTLELVAGRGLGLWPEVEQGLSRPRVDSFCHAMLGGAPNHTSDAARDPHYAGPAARSGLGVTSYVGVPIEGRDGEVLGTLCGLDRASVPVADETVRVLHRLAGVIAAHLEATRLDGVIIRRTPGGWSVEGDVPGEAGDLVASMVLADLLADDLAPGTRPPRSAATDELSRLRASVTQLEHALARAWWWNRRSECWPSGAARRHGRHSRRCAGPRAHAAGACTTWPGRWSHR